MGEIIKPQQITAGDLALGIRGQLKDRRKAYIPLSDNNAVTLKRGRSLKHPLRQQTTIEIHHRINGTPVFSSNGITIETFPSLPFRQTREPIVYERLLARRQKGTSFKEYWYSHGNGAHDETPGAEPAPAHIPTLSEFAKVLTFLESDESTHLSEQKTQEEAQVSLASRIRRKADELFFAKLHEENAEKVEQKKAPVRGNDFTAKFEIGELAVHIKRKKRAGFGPLYTVSFRQTADSLWIDYTIDRKSRLFKVTTTPFEVLSEPVPLAAMQQIATDLSLLEEDIEQ